MSSFLPEVLKVMVFREPGKGKAQPRNCLDEIGLWACLCGMVLTDNKLSPLWAGPSLDRWAWAVYESQWSIGLGMSWRRSWQAVLLHGSRSRFLLLIMDGVLKV